MSYERSLVFDRNNYFKGKLLTAKEFKLEQDYYVNIRRFLNELVYCGGVMSGLRVRKSEADDSAVVVGAGVAVDYLGREIVVREPSAIKLKPAKDQNYAYLVIKYKMSELDETLSLWNPDCEEKPCVILRDGYDLEWEYAEGSGDIFIKDKLTGDALFWDRKLIYSGGGFTITQSVPRFTQPGRFVEFKIDVVKQCAAKGDIEFSYKLNSKYIKTSADEDVIVSFSESLHVPSSEYSLRVQAVATPKMTEAAELSIVRGSLRISIDKKNIEVCADDVVWQVSPIETDVRTHLRGVFLQRDFKDVISEHEEMKLYLAKVYFERKDGICGITSIENVPFGQYLDSWRLNSVFLGAMPSLLTQNEALTVDTVRTMLNALKDELDKQIRTHRETLNNLSEVIQEMPAVTSGVAIIPVSYPKMTVENARGMIINGIKELDERLRNQGITGKGEMERRELIELLLTVNRGEIPAAAERLFTDTNMFETKPIDSLLGKRLINVSCTLVSEGKDRAPDAELSTEINKESGTFIIRGRLRERTDCGTLRVAWNAAGDGGLTREVNALRIIPAVCTVSLGSPAPFNCFLQGKELRVDSGVIWRVVSGDAAITTEGYFTAKGEPGLYAIAAEHKGLAARAFILVEEK